MGGDDQRLLQAIRVGNIGIFDHDHQAGSIYWSPELRKMYGWDETEQPTVPKVLTHVHPEEAERVGAAVRRAHDPDGDGLFDIEHRIIDRRGDTRWLLTRSQTHFESFHGVKRPSRTIGAVQDVTERRTAEERLRVLDAVLRSSAQAIAIADASGKLTFANMALCRLWGYPDEESLVGRSIFAFWKTADEPAAAFEQVRQNQVKGLEMPAARVDGSPFYLGVTAEAVCDAKGGLTQILVTFTDITNRKRLEAQLIHAQKMESIGRLAGGVAHDFNNLLTVISGGIELSLAALAPSHPGHEYLAGAAEAARSAASLTRQLLAFSRKGPIAPRALDLNEVIHRMEKVIVRLLGEDIVLSTSCGTDLFPISFDPAQVEQIILNLAVNARDAMVGGGRLTIETSNLRIDESDAKNQAGATAGDYVLLSVSDDGVGMTDEVRAHLFEPFFTTKEPAKGTGLGLAMVYGAVEQNCGRIEVESTIHKGTTFRIYLPAAKSALVKPAPRPALAGSSRTASILLVEDDPGVRAFGTTVLEKVGHTIHAFSNGDDALAELSSLRPVPDLLVADVIMPGMNGRVLAERAAAILPSIRVLFVSGYTHNVIEDHGILRDGIEFLAKPYSPEQLSLRVRQILEKPMEDAAG